MTIPGFTSTGSKRPEALFGVAHADLSTIPLRMVRAHGCHVWDSEGREYLDTIMALGAVALGYGYASVVEAVTRAAADGIVGPLPPVREQQVAERLGAAIPGTDAVHFFKTGAEAVAGAVRIARVVTGRTRVVTCGYHGWLDWCQETPGVPEQVKALRDAVPFNDVEALRGAVITSPPPAAIVLEPVIDGAPDQRWLQAARDLASQTGAVLVFDEIKTAFRIAVGGAAERYEVIPDLSVVGKALGNGMPIAAVCGSRELMEACTRTWISSTLATESVSLAAAYTVLDTFERADVCTHLDRVGALFYEGLARLAANFPNLTHGVRGIPQMAYLEWQDQETSSIVACECARRGLLFKRNAYNFVSLAHTEVVISEIIARLEEAMQAAQGTC